MNVIVKAINAKRFLGKYYIYVGRRANRDASQTTLPGFINALRNLPDIGEFIRDDLKTIGIDAKVTDDRENAYIRVKFQTQEDMNLYKTAGKIEIDSNGHTVNG